MVSFQCDGCADTVKKPKLDSHRQRCHAPFTCLDCSTTFRGQEYKGHTSCITEAEKYQGALYKGAKKGKGAEAPAPAAAPEPAPAAAASESSIHPSRLQAIEAGPSQQSQYQSNHTYGRGGRGGRGGFNPRGGRAPYGGRMGAGATGENRLTPGNGMRSWGSTPVNGSPAPESDTAPPAAPAPVPAVNGNAQGDDQQDKKKKKRKGDKGGTGSKANSKRPKADETEAVVPAAESTTPATTVVSEDTSSNKKRKRDPSPAASAAAAAAPSDKTLKRIRKNLSKLSPAPSLTLGDFIAKVSKGKKDETLDQTEILQGLKVGQVDGKWVLELPA